MRYVLATLAMLCLMGVAKADDTKFVIGKEYLLQMTGCVDRTTADAIAKEGKDNAQGFAAYKTAKDQGICGNTEGPTRFTKLLDTFEDNADTLRQIWYVEYQVQVGAKWATFWGFCIYPVVDPDSI